MIFRPSLLIFLFFLVHAEDLNVINSLSVNDITCPNYQTGRLTKPRKLAELFDKSTREFWNHERFLSKNALKLKNILLYMVNSNVKLWKNAALSVSAWSWARLREIDEKPNFCIFAKIVNATVTCLEDHDYDPLLEVLDLAENTVKETAKLLTDYGIKKAGCSKHNSIQLESTDLDCYHDGFVYDIDKLCKLEGMKYPKEYISIIKKLYKSKDKEDKILALIATTFLPSLIISTDEMDMELKFELYAMANADKIPEQCCVKFVEEVETLLIDCDDAIEKKMIIVKKEARCYDPYHKQMCYSDSMRTDDLQPRRLINIRY